GLTTKQLCAILFSVMARPTKPMSTDYDFVVEQVPVFMRHNGEFVRTGDYANQRMDTGARVGITSEKYGIVQNGDLLNMVKDTFGTMSLGDYEEKSFVVDEGKRFYGQFDFPQQNRAPVVGDDVSLRLTVRNSYDKTCRASVSVGMLRLVCTNGMTSMRKAASLSCRHSSTVSIASIRDGIADAVSMFDDSVKDLTVMAGKDISHEQGVLILNNLSQKKVLSESLKDSIELVWNEPTHSEDNGRSVYNLYNACTQHLTHVGQSRFEYSSKRSDAVL
ncbi:uncharacterized protein METZ01_LOCUS415020, partial [marine metagenome]